MLQIIFYVSDDHKSEKHKKHEKERSGKRKKKRDEDEKEKETEIGDQPQTVVDQPQLQSEQQPPKQKKTSGGGGEDSIVAAATSESIDNQLNNLKTELDHKNEEIRSLKLEFDQIRQQKSDSNQTTSKIEDLHHKEIENYREKLELSQKELVCR